MHYVAIACMLIVVCACGIAIASNYTRVPFFQKVTANYAEAIGVFVLMLWFSGRIYIVLERGSVSLENLAFHMASASLAIGLISRAFRPHNTRSTDSQLDDITEEEMHAVHGRGPS
jgi:hypothetical protein